MFVFLFASRDSLELCFVTCSYAKFDRPHWAGSPCSDCKHTRTHTEIHVL